jgi:hypothetical protein
MGGDAAAFVASSGKADHPSPDVGRFLMSDSHGRMRNVRAERFTALVIELLPAIRELRPRLNEDQLMEAARRMAEYRLIDEGLYSGQGR